MAAGQGLVANIYPTQSKGKIKMFLDRQNWNILLAKDFHQRWWEVLLKRKAISNGRLEMSFGWGDRKKKSKMTVEKNNSIFKNIVEF